MAKKSPAQQLAHHERVSARRALLEELFNDFYDDRRNIYKMNFFRGIFFGLGSVLGATIVVAIIVWLLSFFVNIPGIGNEIQKAQDTLQSAQRK